jgi:EF-P beta-lysylation protein EpmB
MGLSQRDFTEVPLPLTGLHAPSAHDWQQQLRDVITSRDELLSMLGLSIAQVGMAGGACDDFALKVPRSFAARMRPGDPHDPLLLQVLSSANEMITTAGYDPDPVGESGTAIPQRGIIHKYNGRVLLIVSGGCAINCRYCFRRHFPYQENQNSRRQWLEALTYISTDPSIEEVIFSGGDPLVATDQQLGELVDQIASIPHVKRLRIHSRLPIVIPQRVTDALLDAITDTNLQTVMVVHCNHAQEIDEAVALAITALRRRNITVLNQAVLLADINNSIEAQIALCQRLFAAGIIPYYLHLLDKVQGAAHFDAPENEAKALLRAMTVALPGYMVPKLVREVAGADSKVGVPL